MKSEGIFSESTIEIHLTAHFSYCSVDSEKIPPVLPPLTTMLVIQIDITFFTGIAHLNLKGSPKPVALP